MKAIYKQSFLYSLGAAAWIALVASFMQKANDWFGTQDSMVSVTAILLIFATTALIVGGLLVGRPIFLYIDGKKKEAVKMVVANAIWMVLFVIIALAILVLTK